MKRLLALTFIIIVIFLGLYFYGYFNHEKIKLLLYGNMKTSNCIYIDMTDNKDKIKFDNPDKNKEINNMVGKYGIKEIHINSSGITILYDGSTSDINIELSAYKLNKIYGNYKTYVSVIKDKNKLITYTIINKDNFTYFKKSKNTPAEIPDVDFYIYGYGEPPQCI